MNFKSLFGLKAASDLTPKLKAMAARVATAEGCVTLEQDLQQQLASAGGFTAATRLIRRQLDEVRRIAFAHRLAADRKRAVAQIKRDREEASKGLEVATSRLVLSDGTLKDAVAKRTTREETVARLEAELAEIRRLAAAEVSRAEATLKAAISDGDEDADAESAAFEKLKTAREHLAKTGEGVAARLGGHREELQRLVVAEQQAQVQLTSAQEEQNKWRHQLASIDFDLAAQGVLDAWVAARAAGVAVKDLDLAFTSRGRAALGEVLLGESCRLRMHVLAELVKAFDPADLDLLLTVVPSEEVASPTPEPAPIVQGGWTPVLGAEVQST